MKRAMLRRRLSDLWAENHGAAAVQFIAILPVFVLIVIGLWAFFSVYTARDALCDATREAARYLQVEGPLFPDTYLYPEDWRREGAKVVESELKSHQWHELTPVLDTDIKVFPEITRRAPQEMSEVTVDLLPDYYFFVQVSKSITNPIAFLLPDAESANTLRLSCQSVAYFEGKPLSPTQGPAGGGPGPGCPNVPPCTQGPPGAPTPTDCPIGQICQPTPCPPCQP
jgi:hypothetical protein